MQEHSVEIAKFWSPKVGEYHTDCLWVAEPLQPDPEAPESKEEIPINLTEECATLRAIKLVCKTWAYWFNEARRERLPAPWVQSWLAYQHHVHVVCFCDLALGILKQSKCLQTNCSKLFCSNTSLLAFDLNQTLLMQLRFCNQHKVTQ